jgi:gamma-glutamylcyclotransferase (GGCT)/AIG2-like uncharacterized protein YtfP
MSSVTDTNIQYPFFVYGTLRHGESNYPLLRGRTTQEEPAYVLGYDLYSLGAFPMILPSANAQARLEGELMHITSSLYTLTTTQLDQLEDYQPHDLAHSWYIRVLVTAYLHEGGECQAWLYVGQPQFLPATAWLIPHGDWVKFRILTRYTGRT